MTYRLIELTVHKEKINLFQFLQDQPSKVYKKGDHYRFVYFEPLNESLTPFEYKGLTLRLRETSTNPTKEGWELVRDYPLAIAKKDFLEILLDLEHANLKKQRQARGLHLVGEVFDMVTFGLFTRQDVAVYCRLMFVNGYDFEQATALFTVLVKKVELVGYYVRTAKKIFVEG